MGQDSQQMIRAENERAREALAGDLYTLSEKLNVKKQVDRKRHGYVDNIKGKLHLGGGSHSGQKSPGANELATGVAAEMSQGGGSRGNIVSLFETMREHPVATVAVGVGARTIITSWQAKHPHQVSAQLDEVKSELKETTEELKEATAELKEEAASFGSKMSSRATDARARFQEVVPGNRGELEDVMSRNLLVCGIGALAAGAICGLLMPRTRFENEQVGGLRDQLSEQVGDKLIEATDAAMESAQAGMSTPSTAQPQRPGMITGTRANMPPVPIDDVESELTREQLP